MSYLNFIKNKQISDISTGHEPGNINNILFDFQKDIVRWAIRRGRAAIFADCGLGKTIMQLEWARSIYEETKANVIILAPLAVSRQTAREAKNLLNLKVTICKNQDDVSNGINITNYEKLHNFDANSFVAVVLDESSIIKHHTSKTRDYIISAFSNVNYRLACTATPSPNDYMELGNHAEFLGVMTRSEMLSMFFIHDGGDTAKWRLKGHAEDEFWKWLCSWAVMIRKPSDLGYADEGFTLPKLSINNNVVKLGKPLNGMLFPMPAKTLQERRQARRESLVERCLLAAKIVNKSNEQWVVWCDLNAESKMLSGLIHDAIEVRGSDSQEHKENAMIGFSEGKYRVIVSKTSIAGFGMNWQHCHNMAYVGISDSFEAYYQGTRRCWRFGQKLPVNVHIITSDMEGNVVVNIERKEQQAQLMSEKMITHMKNIQDKNVRGFAKTETKYNPLIRMEKPAFVRAI